MICIREIPEYPGYGISLDGPEATLWSRWNQPHKAMRDSWKRVSSRTCPKSGHIKVRVCKDGKRITQGIHRLVLMAFVGPCPEGMEACHWNDIKTDNRVENLRWATRVENRQDCHRNGKGSNGSRNPRAKLHERDIPDIRRMIKGGMLYKDIASRYGVDPVQICFIKTGKTWKHVPVEIS